MKLTKRELAELSFMTRHFHNNAPGSQIEIEDVARAVEDLIAFIILKAEIVEDE